VYQWNESHPLSSQDPLQYGGTKMGHQKLIPNPSSVGGEFEHQALLSQGQQGDRMQANPH